MGKSNFLLLLLLIIALPSISQRRFIYLKDKNNSTYSISQPDEFLSSKAIQRRFNQSIPITERDIPVVQGYIDQIKAAGANVIYSSKWMNALLIEADNDTYLKIKNLSFVKPDEDISFARKKRNSQRKKAGHSYKYLSQNYGDSFLQNNMIGINEMHQDNYHGEGITIAVLDAGFYKVNELTIFDSLTKKNKIISTYDFVNKEKEVYQDNYHGMQVLSTMGGYLDGSLIGGAYKSNYILLKTEDDFHESRIEEIYWLLGAEYADSLGADIITSSLGYYDFDNPNENYTHEDLDGNTSIITKAADFAAATGMLVIISVGNEGDNQWGKMTVPADADSVLTVGSVNAQGDYSSFSSRGNTADNRIKPDVMAFGDATIIANSSGGIATNKGTSFSAPIVAALAAGLWQSFPELKNVELMNLIRRSGDRFYNPDSIRGYGIPNYIRARTIQINGIQDIDRSECIVYPNPLNTTSLIISDNNFKDSEQLSVYIYNTDFKLVFNTELKSYNKKVMLNEADLITLSPGTYFIKLSSGKGGVLKKLIKL